MSCLAAFFDVLLLILLLLCLLPIAPLGQQTFLQVRLDFISCSLPLSFGLVLLVRSELLYVVPWRPQW